MDQKLKQKNSNSNPNKIIINSKEERFTFEKETYKEEFLTQCINKKEYDIIINEASKIMGQSWSKKRTNDQIKLPKFVIYLALLAVILTIIYMIMLYLSTSSENGSILLIISIVSVTISSIIAFGLSIYNFSREIGKFKSLDLIIKEDLDSYFKNINIIYEGKLEFSYKMVQRLIECKILKRNTNKFYNTNEDVEEDPQHEDVEEDLQQEDEVEFDENTINNNSKKHSRVQSHIVKKFLPRFASMNMDKIVSHTRTQSTNIHNRKEIILENKEVELISLKKDD